MIGSSTVVFTFSGTHSTCFRCRATPRKMASRPRIQHMSKPRRASSERRRLDGDEPGRPAVVALGGAGGSGRLGARVGEVLVVAMWRTGLMWDAGRLRGW